MRVVRPLFDTLSGVRLIAAVSTLCVLGLLAACSSDDSNEATPDGGSSSGSTNPEGGSPVIDGSEPHYWTLTTNAEHYKVFSDRAAAIAWFQGVQDRGDNGLENDKPVPATDGRYADIDKKVDEVWKGFLSEFPQNTDGVPTPIVILIESPKPGAYAVFDPELGLAPNVFMIQTPTLALEEDAVRGVIAHELAHHVLKHKWPGKEDEIEKWYDATSTVKDGLGFQQANDSGVKTTGKRAQIYGLSTGDYPLAQWNGATRPSGSLDDFVGYLHVKAKATNAAACADSDAAYIALLDFTDPLRDRATSTLEPTPDELTKIDTLSKDYIQKETTCASVVKGSFFALVGEALGISEAEARSSASDAELEANDAASSPFDALVRLTKKYDDYLVTTDLKNVRYYSFEEQADDTSIGVLKALGFASDGITKYLRQGALDETGRARCNSFQENEPPYGIISDPHHSTCWRIWHTQKMAAFLNPP